MEPGKPKGERPQQIEKAKQPSMKPAVAPCRSKRARLGMPGFEHMTRRAMGGDSAGRGRAPAPEPPRQPDRSATPALPEPPRPLAPRGGQPEGNV
eukprot:7031525-Alexandrium_andersonii.AAC.1